MSIEVPLDEVMHFDVVTHNASTGAISDADSTPTFAVYEESTDTDIGVGGNLTKRTSLTGNYRGSFTVSTANGFEVGKWYSVIASATVSTIAGKTVAAHFRCVAAEASAGFRTIDVSKINNQTVSASGTVTFPNATLASTTNITAGTITTATNVTTVNGLAANVITSTSINNDAITAAKIANGAIDAATFAADVDAEILSYLVDDATRIDASALNTLSSHDPGETIMGATDLGTGSGLTSLASQSSVNTIDDYLDTEISSIISAIGTVDTVVDAIKVTTDKLDTSLELDGSVYRYTTNALEQGPSGGGGSTDWTTDERTAIRSILGIPASGTTPDDPTVGILDTIRDAIDVVDNFIDTEVSAIKAKTDNLPSDPADASDIAASFSTVNTKLDTIDDFLDTEIAAIKTVTDGLNTQLADLPTVSEFNARTLPSADYFDWTVDTVAHVTLVDTLTTYTSNTPQTGDSYAIVNSVTHGNAALKTLIDTVDNFIDTEIAAIKAKTDNLPSDPADASDIAASFATVNTKLDDIDNYVDTEVAAIKAKTDNLPASFPTNFSTLVIDGSGFTTFNNTSIETVTNLTNLPTMPTDWITALGLSAGAVSEIQSGLSTYNGSDTSGTTTLLSRLTASRSGYLDNLNVGGNVASSTEVTAIQNNTRVVRVVPEFIERPDSGTVTYRVELFLYDTTGNMEAPDSAPTITLVNQSGTDRSSRLDSTTMSLVETGRYRTIYTADSADTLEQLVWTFSVVEGGTTRKYGNQSLIVDNTSVDFTSSDRTTLTNINNYVDELESRLTATRAGYLDNLTNLDATISSRLASASYVAPDNTSITAILEDTGTTIPSQISGLNNLSAAQVNTEVDTALADVGLTTTVTGRIDVAVGSRLATASYTAPDNTGIGNIYAIVNNVTYGNSAIKNILDGLPSANIIADTVGRRTSANMEDSANGDTLALDSLYGLLRSVSHSETDLTELIIYKDDGTELGRKDIESNSGAQPITGIS